MGIDIVVKVAIPILGAIITYILVPYFKAKTTEKQRENIYFWVRVAVGAAEQIYKEKGQGAFKKEYALNFLNGKGIEITEQQLDILIEAAVFEMNQVIEGG